MHTSQRRAKSILAFLFLLPTLCMILVFSYYPAISAFVYSFTEWDGFLKPSFIGFKNYVEIFTSSAFSTAFLNLLWIALFQILTAITVPLLIARFIYKVKNRTAQNYYRLMFVFPLVIPLVVILLLWQFILNADYGLVNAVLAFFGVQPDKLPLWLGSPDTALISLLMIGFPWVNGVAMLIYLAGFQNIPASIIEAATMDGAKGLKMFFRIELPLIFSQIKLILILTIISNLQDFQTQLILTGGGPGDSTTVPGLVMYREAFSHNRLGFACAIGTILFILIFAVTQINNRYIKSSTEYTAD